MLEVLLWDLGDTEREFYKEKIEPSTISIHKWESFANALANIYSRVGQGCGLCFEKDRLGWSCDGCPLAILDAVCSHDDSLFKQFVLKLSEAREFAGEMIDALRAIEAEKLIHTRNQPKRREVQA